jgi:hypothetical protein
MPLSIGAKAHADVYCDTGVAAIINLYVSVYYSCCDSIYMYIHTHTHTHTHTHIYIYIYSFYISVYIYIYIYIHCFSEALHVFSA